MSQPPEQDHAIVPILAGLAVLLALAGQFLFTLGPTPEPAALFCFAAAVVFLLLAERLAQE
jgi:hypothetical protein